MIWKRHIAAVVVCCAAVALGPTTFAQDTGQAPPPPAEDDSGDDATPLPAPQYQKRESKIRLYVELAYGQVENDPINTSISTSSIERSPSELIIDESDAGRAILGWKLKNDRGWFLGRFEGYKETSFSFRAEGRQARVVDSNGNPVTTLASSPITWWIVEAGPQQWTATKSIPVWDLVIPPENPLDPPGTDDANGNGIPDPEEVNQDFSNPDVVIQNVGPNNLQNRLQVFDALYQRDFGGRKYSGRWNAGMRYFAYEGNIVATTWVNDATAGVGFSDGGFIRPLTFAQETTGIGPTGSLEFRMTFFRDRFVIYGLGRTAFVLQDVTTDSGVFFTLVRDPGSNTLVPAAAELKTERSKASWHFGLEIGFEVRLVDQLFFNLFYQGMSYQDAILLPTNIIIPDDLNNAAQGTSGVYSTQDYEIEGGFVGLSYQF
jgi:hypothetical protein